MVVVKGKDIIKYILKLILIIVLLLSISSFFKININKRYSELISTEKLIGCINSTIPGIKQFNNKNENFEEHQNINLLKIIIENQITMLASLKEKNAIIRRYCRRKIK